MNTFQSYLEKTGEVGFVERVVSSLAYANGLPGARPDEMVVFESGGTGRITALKESTAEIVSFSRVPLRVGIRVARADRVFEIPVGEGMLGAAINPLGESLDPASPLPAFDEYRPIEAAPGGIESRLRITAPCATGVSFVDRLLPLGKGQRELILGDQKTGKTRFLLRAMLAQVKEGSVGVYALIGKGRLAARQVLQALRDLGIMQKVVLVVASADDAAGLICLAPYSAMTIAEYFRDHGRDVLLMLDDLSIHAKMYRELSLLGRKFPGRNSYPGDIFYAHARLLERAGNFKNGAITCLPVAETPRGDLTGYISTNLMSMTDGHLLFDHVLFAEGRRPAIDPFLSVTRVGRQTQSRLEREILSELLTFLKSVERMHAFASFGAELGRHIKEALSREKRIMQFFDQTAYETASKNIQIILFGLAWGRRWLGKTPEEIRRAINQYVASYEKQEEFRKKADALVAACNSVKELVEMVDMFEPESA